VSSTPRSGFETAKTGLRGRKAGRLGIALLLLTGHPGISSADSAVAPSASTQAIAEISARLAQLETRVTALQDVEAIRSLRQRYHEYVNEGRHAEIAELFADQGVVDFGELGRRVGREAIHSFFAKELINDDLSFIKQFNHNHAVEVSGDRATGSSYLEAKNVISGEATLVAARYDDTYLRSDAGWRFQEMKLTLYFVTPFSRGWGESAQSPETH